MRVCVCGEGRSRNVSSEVLNGSTELSGSRGMTLTSSSPCRLRRSLLRSRVLVWWALRCKFGLGALGLVLDLKPW